MARLLTTLAPALNRLRCTRGHRNLLWVEAAKDGLLHLQCVAEAYFLRAEKSYGSNHAETIVLAGRSDFFCPMDTMTIPFKNFKRQERNAILKALKSERELPTLRPVPDVPDISISGELNQTHPSLDRPEYVSRIASHYSDSWKAFFKDGRMARNESKRIVLECLDIISKTSIRQIMYVENGTPVSTTEASLGVALISSLVKESRLGYEQVRGVLTRSEKAGHVLKFQRVHKDPGLSQTTERCFTLTQWGHSWLGWARQHVSTNGTVRPERIPGNSAKVADGGSHAP